MSRADVPRRRADAERSRAAVVAAAARQLAGGPIVDMRALAHEAGVSRSTLYRHFASAEAVRAGLVDAALADAERALAAATREARPPLAQLHEAVAALVAVGAAYSVARVADLLSREAVDALAPHAVPLAERIAALSGFDPAPAASWLRVAVGQAVEACLTAAVAGDDVAAAAGQSFDLLTGALDRGLVVVDPIGQLLGVNGQGLEALAIDAPRAGEAIVGPRVSAYYEDGTRCPNDAYPLARAVLTGETQEEVVRGHLHADGAMRWYLVRADALRRSTAEPAYGVVASFTDVTDERDADLRRLRPPGTLGRHEPASLDVARVLDTVPAQLLPDQIVAEARRLVEVPVALYVVDIDGTRLIRLAGTDEFPAQMAAPLALGPELAEDGIPGLRARLERDLPGAVMAPLWLRGRAVGLLLAFRGRQDVLEEIARQAAPAMELANGYTDVFDAARRRKHMNPAAELQQSLLPPRIARFGGGQIAGGVLPSYDTGGDWFDYVENRDGAWLAIADAAGRGAHAGALGSVALAALRGARRSDQTLEESVGTMHETMCAGGETEFFLTAIVARWAPVHASFSWVNAGHPPPLLLQGDDSVVELKSRPLPPLGLGPRKRSFRRAFRRLEADDRVILYTDGVSLRPVGEGFFGREGIARAAQEADGRSASAIARAIQEQVVAASEQPLRDDAAVVVLAPAPG